VTFQERADKSVNNLRVLFDLDITQINSLWINHGAGVWVVNVNGLYPWVDASLLSGFSVVQSISNVGSVLVDSIQLTQADTLLECSENVESFYWDGENLYITCPGWDSPYLHQISVGVVSGYSKEGFTPINANQLYESRLLSVPSISKSRDPLFWGKIQYEGGSVDINNADGELDQYGENYNVYGNQARVSIGFADQDYSEYVRLFTGFVETLSLNEERFTVSFKDRRKSLTKKVAYTCTACNALQAIEDILLDNYAIPYNALYYNIQLWEAAKARASNVTIAITSGMAAIDIIQGICESTFGTFIVDPDGKYGFKIIRSTDPAMFTIPNSDILNNPTATYDPSEVITSTRVGYAKDWTTTGSAFTYLNDTSQEAAIYEKYKVYNERTFDTYLPDLSSAQDFSDEILDYSGDIRARFEIEVPIKYYNVEVGDFADITINRPHVTWFGERKCEVISKVFNLDLGTITLGIRKYGGEIFTRITTDGSTRLTTDGDIRRVGA